MTAPARPSTAGTGARHATTAVRNYLADALVRDGVLASPDDVVAGAPRPTTVGRFPVVYVNRRTADGRHRGDASIAVGYRLRVYGFARGQTHDEVEQAVDDLALRLRELLLAGPSAGGRLIGPGIRPEWREDYSDVDTDDLGRSLAGVYLEVTVDVDERLPTTALGRADTITVTGVPSHPALD